MDNTIVYDKYDWSNIDFKHLKGKIEKILDVIPADVETIMDIGCGNGIITNILGQKFEVTAVDRSEHALSFVETKKVQASCDNIPVSDKSYDMVFSSELLEHLNDEVLAGTVAEIKRLTKKYIFITVPNNENADKLSIKCAKCKYIYNSPNHLRSFDINKLQSLFQEHKLIDTFTFGKKVRYYNRGLLKVKTKLSPSSSWIPYYWIPKEKRNTTCPSCEHSFHYDYKFNPISFGVDVLNVLISPKKPYWLFAVFEKK